MKFYKIIPLLVISFFVFQNCKQSEENRWKINLTESKDKVKITDISKDFFDENISLEQFKTNYPWFQGTVSDEDFVKRRKDSAEIAIYKEAISKINLPILERDINLLFSHIHHYFPKFKSPKVYLYSSALQGIMEPIFYQTDENLVFIDISAFMGENNKNYKGLDLYFQKSMNFNNIIPKLSQVMAENIVVINPNEQKYIDKMVYFGKIQILQDAFLPDTPDALKMNYSPEQYEWTQLNESNIWNYFVENNLVFSDDSRLDERFLSVAPFSKFYTEIDNESSPRVGVFIGWKICKSFFNKNPETQLTDFLNMNATEIFNKAEYKP